MNDRISEDVLELWYLDLQNKLYEEVYAAFKRSGMSQDEIADRLDKDKSTISKWLRGLENMKLRSYSDLARALDCRLEIHVEDLKDVRKSNAPMKIEFVNLEAGERQDIRSETRVDTSSQSFRPLLAAD